MYYKVTIYDAEGFTIAESVDVEGLKSAKECAKDYLLEFDIDRSKKLHATVENDANEVIWDMR